VKADGAASKRQGERTHRIDASMRGRPAGCERARASNRDLHFDDYVLLVLLYLFNPLIDSMRVLQKVAELFLTRHALGRGTRLWPSGARVLRSFPASRFRPYTCLQMRSARACASPVGVPERRGSGQACCESSYQSLRTKRRSPGRQIAEWTWPVRGTHVVMIDDGKDDDSARGGRRC
jgi:hypothetical protein